MLSAVSPVLSSVIATRLAQVSARPAADRPAPEMRSRQRAVDCAVAGRALPRGYRSAAAPGCRRAAVVEKLQSSLTPSLSTTP